ncbi:quaternary ammonium compound efflux SMR transporter QacL, partial [Salmonella enterica subsp. enterica serovar Kentucky]|nr:quaternary ammonium compound efflux SMR transporter QacL [Salmonella enterica subsp. enterica serovar Kentucky]
MKNWLFLAISRFGEDGETSALNSSHG